MPRNLLILVLLLAALGGAERLAAQERVPSPFRYVEETHSAGAYAGYLWTEAGDLDLGPQAAPQFGVRYSLQLGGPVAGVAAVGLILSERTVFALRADPDNPQQTIPLPVGTTSMPLLLVEGGVRLNLTGPRTWHGLMPYLGATGGLVTDLARNEPEDLEIPEDERFRFGPGFAVGLGAGTDWFLTPRLSLRAEIRDQIWRIALPETFTGPQRETRWTNNLGLSIGAAVHF